MKTQPLTMKDAPAESKRRLLRTIFERAMEHANQLGIKVRVKHGRGYTDFNPEHLLLVET